MWIIYLIIFALIFKFFVRDILSVIIMAVPVFFVAYILPKMGVSLTITSILIIFVSLFDLGFVLIKSGKLTITDNKKR